MPALESMTSDDDMTQRECDDFVIAADRSAPQLGGFITEIHESVATITLSRPDKMNALSRAFWPTFRATLDGLEQSSECRAIILTGEGNKVFCAGGDIASFEALGNEGERRVFQTDCMETFARLEGCALPTIAAVNGMALGGGTELAMACDMVVAADQASFGLPEAQFGLVPGYGVLKAPAILGRQITNWLILGGERLSADQALAAGLVQKRVRADELMTEAMALAKRVASLSPESVAAAKRLVAHAVDGHQMASSIDIVTELHGTVAAEKARRAFLKKR